MITYPNGKALLNRNVNLLINHSNFALVSDTKFTSCHHTCSNSLVNLLILFLLKFLLHDFVGV